MTNVGIFFKVIESAFGSFVLLPLFSLEACLGLHQNHSGVKTGGSASANGDFSLVLVLL